MNLKDRLLMGDSIITTMVRYDTENDTYNYCQDVI